MSFSVANYLSKDLTHKSLNSINRACFNTHNCQPDCYKAGFFVLIIFFSKDKYCLYGLTEGIAYFGLFCNFIFLILFNLIKHRTANFIIFFFSVKITCGGPLLILYNHIIIRETGSKKALYFLHNETPKLSSSKVF